MSSDQPPPPPLTNFFSSIPPPIPHHHSSSSLSPSILIIILILAITFVASVSLCVLLRHLNRRCLRHLSPSSTSSSSAAAATAGDSLRISSRRVSPENPTTALIESLPLFTFSSLTRRGASAADCAVCLSKFEADDQLRLLPLCCHAFHALCVDTWLQSNQTCPLCRSPIFVSETEILKTILSSEGENRGGTGNGDSFRIEIGNISRRRTASDSSELMTRRSYSIGSFEYLVDEESEIVISHAHRRSVSDFKEDQTRPPPPPPLANQLPAPEPSLVTEVASGRSWLKEYVDRLSMSLSSRAQSFRSSGFFSGSSRRSDVPGVGEWDLEASRVGEEISELFRCLSGYG